MHELREVERALRRRIWPLLSFLHRCTDGEGLAVTPRDVMDLKKE